MNSLTGSWDVTMRTPIGSFAAVYHFADTADGLIGTAENRDETVVLTDIQVAHGSDGGHATWRQSVTKPMRLHLQFQVTVAGDTLTGHSRAGRLPPSHVRGTRRRD